MKLSCPIPISTYPTITLAHGGGGLLMHQLIGKMFRTAFDNDLLAQEHDGAIFASPGDRLAYTTDSFVVRPLFFPGGDIGKLAVCGTVNDLAMCGAKPLYLSLGFILEEGLPMEQLWNVVQSIQATAKQADVKIVTGDTKVVDHGKGDGIYINTSGVGVVLTREPVSPRSVRPGDAVLVNGDIGRHGISIMAVREGLSFETTIESDCAPLAGSVQALVDAGIELHCMRDCTRGGVASTLNEIAASAGCTIAIDQKQVPVLPEVEGACEMLGFDPLYVANEGRFVAFVPGAQADKALSILRAQPDGERSSILGHVTEAREPRVVLKSLIGAQRILDMLSGEQLPRIC